MMRRDDLHEAIRQSYFTVNLNPDGSVLFDLHSPPPELSDEEREKWITAADAELSSPETISLVLTHLRSFHDSADSVGTEHTEKS